MNNPVGFFLNLDQGSMTNADVIAMLAEVGYDSIEYGISHLDPRSMSSQQMRDLLKETEAGGLNVSEWVVQRELVHPDQSVRESELKLILDCISAAGDLGIGVMNLYTGPAHFMEIGSPVLHQDISEGEAWGMVCQAMDRIVPAAEEAKVRIAIEAVYGMVCREYYTLAELLRRYDSAYLGCNYDPSHMELHYNTVSWTIHQLKDRIFHCHVKDTAGVPGKVMDDTFNFPCLGEGRVDWPGFFTAMKEVGYQGCLSVECETFRYYETTMQKDLRRCAELFYQDYQSLNQQYGS